MSLSTPERYRTQRPGSRRCINCSMMCTPNLRRYIVEELNEEMKGLLQTWIVPTNMTLDDIICLECYVLLQERILLKVIERCADMSPAYGHLHICFGCGISIASRRTHRVELDSPQSSLILRWTPAHLVSRLERVCIACWLAATREAQRTVVDANRSDVMDPAVKSENSRPSSPFAASPVPDPLELPAPMTPQDPLQPKSENTPPHSPFMPASPVPDPIVPAPMTSQDQLQPKSENIPSHSPFMPASPVPDPVELPAPMTHQDPQPVAKVISHKYKRVPASARHCVFDGCMRSKRLLVPPVIKELLLMQYKIYIPLCARICRYHLNNNQWDELTANLNDFTGVQMDDICSILERAAQRHLDSNDVL